MRRGDREAPQIDGDKMRVMARKRAADVDQKGMLGNC